MKNILLFLLACLISVSAVLSSSLISDPELGFATAALVWAFYAWLLLPKKDPQRDFR